MASSSSRGQTIGIGGQLVRLKERSDGTLGVEELVPAPNEQWIEQIDRTVADVPVHTSVLVMRTTARCFTTACN